MDQKEYIERAKRRYMEKAALDEQLAQQFAESAWESSGDRNNPEEDVDEDLSCWGG